MVLWNITQPYDVSQSKILFSITEYLQFVTQRMVNGAIIARLFILSIGTWRKLDFE